MFLIAQRHSQSLKSGIKKVQLRRRGKKETTIIKNNNNCENGTIKQQQKKRNLSTGSGENCASTLRIHFGRHKLRKSSRKCKIDGLIMSNGRLSPMLLYESPPPTDSAPLIQRGSLSTMRKSLYSTATTATIDSAKNSPPFISKSPTLMPTKINPQRVFRYSASSAMLLDTTNQCQSIKSVLTNMTTTKQQHNNNGIDTPTTIINNDTLNIDQVLNCLPVLNAQNYRSVL